MKENFEELIAWKMAREIRKEIRIISKKFPTEEKYKLTDQIVRSSRSVTANIAEGHGRFHYQENIQFCRQARGSLVETLDHLICAFDEDYISDPELGTMRIKITTNLKVLNGYIAYLRKRKSE
jgi:four helix bundle protein